MPCVEIQTPACLLLFLCLLPGEEIKSKFCDTKKLMWQWTYCVMKEQIFIRQPGKFTLFFLLLFREVPFILILLEFFPEYCASCLDCHTFISWKIEGCFTGLISQNTMKHTKWVFQKLKLLKITVLTVLFFSVDKVLMPWFAEYILPEEGDSSLAILILVWVDQLCELVLVSSKWQFWGRPVFVMRRILDHW